MKRIIILETEENKFQGELQFKCAFWFLVTDANKRISDQNRTSLWAGASAPEIQQLRDGMIREEFRQIEVPITMPSAEIKVVLSRAWDGQNAAIAAEPFKFAYRGIYYDDNTGWST